MEVVRAECLGKPLRVEASMAGWQRVFWGGDLVSERAAGYPTEGEFSHRFAAEADAQEVDCELVLALQWEPFRCEHRLLVADQSVDEGVRDLDALQRSTPSVEVPAERSVGRLGLLTLAFKLLKSAKAIKVLLAGASLAAYSWLFSFQFAVALILCLVVHEYGHLRAMQYFGMKTKGMYLIPFLGGLALSDERINTRWQGAVIALMGPTFGLALSVLFLVIYWLTGEAIFAGLSAFNALLNLFNLLPVVPLDGGHVLKSVCFSVNSVFGLLLCIAGALLGVYVSFYFHLSLLVFLLIVGCMEIFLEWKMRHLSVLLPLNRNALVVSIFWYLAISAGFIAIIMYFGSTGDSVLGLPMQVLKS
ncbi:conserved hypothetical protein [gamma proteobacterium HdN1]|nr:conserved hypothetical protein [gamma proteobacterium HdN1]